MEYSIDEAIYDEMSTVEVRSVSRSELIKMYKNVAFRITEEIIFQAVTTNMCCNKCVEILAEQRIT
jgi:hypothetical protein